LICGGGGNCEWYKDTIRNFRIGSGIHLKFDELNSEIIPNARLLTSYALAQFLGLIPEIKRWPLTPEQRKNQEIGYIDQSIEKNDYIYGADT